MTLTLLSAARVWAAVSYFALCPPAPCLPGEIGGSTRYWVLPVILLLRAVIYPSQTPAPVPVVPVSVAETKIPTLLMASSHEQLQQLTRRKAKWAIGARPEGRWNRVPGLSGEIVIDVRFGSKADMNRSNRDVRVTPKSGHHLVICPKQLPARR